MAAVDIIITLAIIIKIIDILITRYKKKNKNIKPITPKPSNNAPVIIVIIILVIGFVATNHKETDQKQSQEIASSNQTQQTKYPTGVYMQPLLSVTTGVINQMGDRMTENAKRVQQEAKRRK